MNTELDSHADTCCVGANVHILGQTHKTVNVTPFLQKLGTIKRAPIVDAAVAYDDPKSGETYILVINQAIHIPEMTHNLLCPMQCRMNDVLIDEVPKFLAPQPSDTTHSIHFKRNHLIIPLELDGVISYFPSRKPTPHELHECRRITLTSSNPEWNPHDKFFAEQESIMLDLDGTLLERYVTNRKQSSTSSKTPIDLLPEAKQFSELLERTVSMATSHEKHAIDSEHLSRKWGIGYKTAQRTLRVTTQRGVRVTSGGAVERRFPTGDRALRYRRLPFQVYHDILKATIPSHKGNTCSEIYATDFGWSRNFPMKRESEVSQTLDLFFHRYGVPETLLSDGALALTQGKFKRTASQASCILKQTEAHSPWMNRAESEIREIKRLAARWKVKSGSPGAFWDDAIQLASLVRSNTAHDMYQLDGQTPETVALGQTADISHICEFSWYEWVYFRDTTPNFPNDKEQLGRWLGPTVPEVGATMCAKILKENGNVLHRSTYRPLTKEERANEACAAARRNFDIKIQQRYGKPTTESSILEQESNDQRSVSVLTPEYDAYSDGHEHHERHDDVDNYDIETYDSYLTAQVLLPKGDETLRAEVLRRKTDHHGNPIGRAHTNPILDTRLYEVRFPDGEIQEFTANTIAENLYAQTDDEGRTHVLMKDIIDHKANKHAIKRGADFITHNGRRHRRPTTKGWKLCIQWKDGSTSWEPLVDIKNAYQVQTAEYAITAGIQDEPAFAWWVPFILKKRNHIISAVRKRYHRQTHKFGIELPKTVEEALAIDRRTNTTFWQDAITKEMKNVRVAFHILEDEEQVPKNYQQIKCHMVFDIKMGSLTRKARLVAGGHTTETPAALTYSSVVSRESVRIGLLLAALNNLDVMCADIQNAYLTAPCVEKIWTTCGPEFGASDQGKRAIVIRSLYGLRASGNSYRYHLATCLQHLGYSPCQADPDIWYKAETRPDDTTYYSYLLVYVDDIMAIGENPRDVLLQLNKYYQLKNNEITPPDLYLGAKIKPTTLPNGTTAWGQSSSKYVHSAIDNVKEWSQKHGYRLPTNCKTPMSVSYRPELDISRELNTDEASYYQSMIGVLRWAVELGRIDITTEVSMLAAHLALPREGHLFAALRIFAYLEKHHNTRIIFNPDLLPDTTTTIPADWTQFYGNIREAIPSNAPPP